MSDVLKKSVIPFSQIPNDLICDPTITSKAKAVYCYLSSRPEDWIFRIKEMQSNFKEGRDAIMNALKELVESGWISKRAVRKKGMFDHNEYTLFFRKNESTVDGKPVTENQAMDATVNWKPVTEKPLTDFPTYTNTEYTNNENKGGKPRTVSSVKSKKDLSGKPANVDEQVWTDFIRQRKTALTPTALNRIKKEAEKAGWALTDALEESVARGWQSFKADWVSKQPIPSQTQDIQSNGLPNGLPKGMRWVGGAR